MFAATSSSFFSISGVSWPLTERCAFTRAASAFAQERTDASSEIY